MRLSRATTFLAIALLASACSPYVYQKEIGLFNKGVDDAIASFEELKQKDRARLTAARDENLKKQALRIQISGCRELPRKYEDGFGKEKKNVLTEADYAACKVVPVGEPKVDPVLPNLTAMGGELKRYAAALGAVTNAEDATALQSAFTEFNSSVTGLVEAVNRELAERNKQKFDAIAGLVYQVGIIYLNQRRFNALKKAVNETHPVIETAAGFMSEAAFSIYAPDIQNKTTKLLDLQIEAAKAKTGGDDYVRAWHLLNAERDAYIELFRRSPVGVFRKLTDTHEALRQSVNDPDNVDQIEEVLKTAKAFQSSAQAALEAFKKN
jgi:hypothetical protein